MLRGVQFGVLCEVLVAVRAHVFNIDGRVLGGMQFEVCCGVLLEVLVTARAHVCSIDGRVLFGALFGVCWRCWCHHWHVVCYLRPMLV